MIWDFLKRIWHSKEPPVPVQKSREKMLWLHQGVPARDLIGLPVDYKGQKGRCIDIDPPFCIVVEWDEPDDGKLLQPGI